MKLLIIANYKDSSPYIPELRRELLKKNIDVDIFNIYNFSIIKANNNILHFTNKRAKLIFNIKKIGAVYKTILLYIYFRKINTQYDIINIHYVLPIYIFLPNFLKKTTQKIVISIWGSDYYRSSNATKNMLNLLYKKSNAITFINPQTKDNFNIHYKRYEKKTNVIRFGLDSLEMIKKIKEKESVETIRKKLKIPLGPKIITCGYNASKHQQHDKIISLVSSNIKYFNNVYFIFPMTYPHDPEYISEIENKLKRSRLNYKIIKTFMQNKDIARLRLATDIALNIQTSDQFSASIQEHLFAENIVIAGKWLPYDIYDKKGVFLYRVDDCDKMIEVLYECLLNYEQNRRVCTKNAEILYKLGSWENNSKIWAQFYSNLLK